MILLFSNNGSRYISQKAGGGSENIPRIINKPTSTKIIYTNNSTTETGTPSSPGELEHQRTTTTGSSVENTTKTTLEKQTTQSLVLSVEYPGQQGSAALCLSTLQCFLSSIYNDFKIVEPYFCKSHFSYRKSALKFSSVFNFQLFNSESKKAHYPKMMSVEDFQRKESIISPVHHKYIIFIHVDWNHRTSKQKVAWSAKYSTDDNVRCLSTNLDDYSRIEARYRGGLEMARKTFGTIWSRRCIVRVIELEITRGAEFTMPPKTVNSVFNFIFDKWAPGDVLLVFSKWPKTFLPVHSPLSGVNCLKEHLNTVTILRQQFHPSQSLLEAAKKYEQQFLNGKNRLAIMLRVERAVDGYLKEKANRGKNIEGCFAEVLSLKAEMDKNFTEVSTPIVTLDIGGKYGTDSFHSERVENLTKKVLEDHLYHNTSWSIAEWENSFIKATGGITERGYVAALQRLLASRADCMILLGGGDFQAFAVTDYLEYHKIGKKCVHVVCSISQENNEVHNTLVSA